MSSLVVVLAVIGCAGAPLTQQLQSSSERDLLQRVHRYVTLTLDDKHPAAARLGLARSTTIREMQALQPKQRPNSRAFAELSFTLALLGHHVRANTERILRPYRLWRSSSMAWQREYSNNGDNGGYDIRHLDEIPALLAELIKRLKQPAVIRELLDLQGLDGAAAETASLSIYDGWKAQPEAVLKAVNGNSGRSRNLAEAIAFQTWDAPANRQKDLSTLVRFTRSKSTAVSSSAKRVMALVRKAN